MHEKTWGGRREGAGRPPLKEGTRKIRTVIYLDPKLLARLERSAKNRRSSLSEYISRLLYAADS